MLLDTYNAQKNASIIYLGLNDTPLHVAALCGKEEVALALIKCDINVKGGLGRLILHNACNNESS